MLQSNLPMVVLPIQLKVLQDARVNKAVVCSREKAKHTVQMFGIFWPQDLCDNNDLIIASIVSRSSMSIDDSGISGRI